MADSYERRQRRRGRNEVGGRGEDASRAYSQSQPQETKPVMKILGLAKPTRAQPELLQSRGNEEGIERGKVSLDQRGEKTSVSLMDSHSHHFPASSSLNTSKSIVSSSSDLHRSAEDKNPQYNQPRKVITSSNVVTGRLVDATAVSHAKLAPPFEKPSRTKLIDEGLGWLDSGFDLMLDQTDFLVIGVVGLQGSGKSTIMSLLAGNSPQDAYRNYIFPPQSKEMKEEGLFQTSGIDMYITSDRIIYLDCQPMLSPAVMDSLIRYDRKTPSDYSSLQNLVEIQSMQLLIFLMSVCNTVIVVDDWFVDMNFLRFVQDAEMLKPSHSPHSDSSSSKDDAIDFFPTLVFVHNKASREDFRPDNYNAMQTLLQCAFSSSKLRYKTGVNMMNNISESRISPLPGKENIGVQDINLVLLPPFEFYKCEPESLETTMPDYRGYPSFNTILSALRAQLLSCQRSPVTHSPLTEKAWYNFAARIWDSVKKSTPLSEYNRLLSS